MIVMMHGLLATGKSVLAKRLADKLNADVYHTAVIRRGLGFTSGFTFLRSDTRFTHVVSPEVYTEMMKKARSSLKKGRDVVLDGTFYFRWEREMAYSLAKETGHGIVILETTCGDLEEIKRRLKERGNKTDPLSEGKDIEIYFSMRENGDPIQAEEMRDVPLVRVDTKWWKVETRGPNSPKEVIAALDGARGEVA